MEEFFAGFIAAAVFGSFAVIAISDTRVKDVKTGVCEQMQAEFKKSVGCVKDDRIVYKFKD